MAGLADEPRPAPVRDSQLVFEGKVWDIRRDIVEFGGHDIVREYTDHTGAVAVLAIDERDRILLIQQYRHPIGARDWEIPAGLLDVDGEPPLATAQRELAEEADLVASEWSEPFSFTTSPGGSNEVVHVFEARGLSAAASVHDRTEEEADIELRWVTLDEAVEAVLEGRLRNAILIVAVLRAHARRH